MINRWSEKSHYGLPRTASTQIGAYLRITDIVIDYFISFHSSHIVPIHLIGRHIKYTVTLMPVTTSVVQRVRLEVAEVSAAKIGGRRAVTTVLAAHTNAHAYPRPAHVGTEHHGSMLCTTRFIPSEALHTHRIRRIHDLYNTHARAHSNTHWLGAARHDRVVGPRNDSVVADDK